MILDLQQQEAVTTTSPRALVLSGAGSGKTRVLIERIAWLIETQKISSSELLAFSFTRKASGEIQDRLKERIGRKAHGVQIGTMHGLALEFIHRFGEAIGLRPAIVTVYGEWEAGYLLADVALEMSAKKPTIRAAKEALERYYQTGEEPSEDDMGHDLVKVFLARCRENNALTYGSLLVGLRFLIPTLAKYLHVRHILVDEIQDIDPLQWAIINEMVSSFKANLFVVGDIDQCQPGETMVLTSTGEDKPLKDLDPKTDKLVTFDRHGCRVYGIKVPQNHNGYFSFKKAVRPFTGHMHTITAGGVESSCTPNHKWPVRYVKYVENERLYCVYIMRQGDRFRIGQCMFFGKRSAGFGFSVRCRLEKADRAWILSVHKRIDEALIQEEVLSYRFGIPQVCFEEHSPGYKKNIIEGVFGGMDLALLLDRVMMCLDEYGRSISFPFYEKRTWTQHGRRKSHECYSCNIIEGICTIPKVTGRKHEWVTVENNSWEMVVEKPVYSLDVDKHHTYIVNGGLVTCNSIYEFRGAVPRYLVDHSGEFDIYRLEANYRSMPEIVCAANRLIEHNHDRITKTMKATRKAPDLAPESVQVENNIQSEGIVAMANARHCKEASVAILARKHSLLGKIDRLMEEAGIPHTYIGKTTTLTNSEPFRRFHAFLKLAVNSFDNFSFLLIRDIIGLSQEEYGRIRLEAADKGKSHFQVFEGNTDFLNLDSVFGSSLSRCAEHVNAHCPDLSPESMAFIQKYLADQTDDIASYLDWLATFDVQDEIKGEETEGITLATIHAAKGLEWPIVIIAGCNEGIIPARPNDLDEIEGERRLFYVAMTRAMDQLILTVRPTESTDAAGRVHNSPESRFITELQGDR